MINLIKLDEQRFDIYNLKIFILRTAAMFRNCPNTQLSGGSVPVSLTNQHKWPSAKYAEIDALWFLIFVCFFFLVQTNPCLIFLIYMKKKKFFQFHSKRLLIMIITWHMGKMDKRHHHWQLWYIWQKMDKGIL